MSAWQLRYHDLFDRDSGGIEAEGEAIVDGLALLWRKQAVEGIAEDGSRTFSAFSLHWPGGRADLPVQPANPGLLNIRRWAAADDTLFDAIAVAHLGRTERARIESGGAEILALASRSADAQEFAARLQRL